MLDGSLDARMAKYIVRKQKVIDAALDGKTTVDLSGPERPVVVDQASVETEGPAGPANFNAKKAAIAELAAKLTENQISAIHQALRTIAAMDGDRAMSLNGIVFNKMDTTFGCDLAGKESLSPKQAAVGMRLARKYQKQYSEELYYSRIFPEHTETGI